MPLAAQQHFACAAILLVVVLCCLAQVGMICSNEPGYYEDGGFGIRVENLLAIQEADTEFRCGLAQHSTAQSHRCGLWRNWGDMRDVSLQQFSPGLP